MPVARSSDGIRLFTCKEQEKTPVERPGFFFVLKFLHRRTCHQSALYVTGIPTASCGFVRFPVSLFSAADRLLAPLAGRGGAVLSKPGREIAGGTEAQFVGD